MHLTGPQRVVVEQALRAFKDSMAHEAEQAPNEADQMFALSKQVIVDEILNEHFGGSSAVIAPDDLE